MPTQPSQYLAKLCSIMLKIICSLHELDFQQLMNVYEEGNIITGKEVYPNLPENLQILYAEQDFYTYLQTFFKDPNARYAIWVEDDRYVSALRFETYNNGLLVTALETAPAERNKGFAVSLLRAVLLFLRSQGNGILYSHIVKDNMTSVNVHLSCGFQIISHEAKYLDGTVRSDSYTLSIEY